MIDVTTLYLGVRSRSHALRYEHRASGGESAARRRPVIVWNVTARCNLACRHCYTNSPESAGSTGLLHDRCRELIDELGAFGCPVLLLSGGEPLTRPDLPELARYAAERGLRVVVSTNGTLIDDGLAQRLGEAGVAYVGVSLDGLEPTNDRFRGQQGAFKRAVEGIRACQRAGLKVGLRYTMTKANAGDVDGVFDLLRAEGIPRVCFYHLVPAGRATQMAEDAPDHGQTRRLVDRIFDHAARLHAEGHPTEVLTVDNHADGPYLYLRMQREEDPRAVEALRLLRASGGNASGLGIGCIGWDGTVYPDQFWRTRPLGNVLERPFAEIWSGADSPFLSELRQKRGRLKGRCAACRFLDVCAGNFRARAEALCGDPWAPDPACYLSDQEIGLA